MRLKKIFILFFGFIFLLAFQNCVPSSPVAFSETSSSKLANDGSGGNGQPYDGKIFVEMGDICPDQTKVQAKIILKSPIAADLVRENCRDIAPIALNKNEFQWDANDPNRLSYQNRLFDLIGTRIDMNLVEQELSAIAFIIRGDFGTPADSMTDGTASRLRFYEDGVMMGPAHSLHSDIRELGGGRFSHWLDAIRFSASDNSDPRTNGRTYSYDIGP